MTEKTVTTEEKIVEATIESIEKFGLDGTTNRRIAELAGVNGAAVNYYFRSKDALIKRAMEVTLKNAFDWEDFADLPEGTAQERAAAIFADLIRGACNYPGLTRAHYRDLVVDGSYDSLAVREINTFLEKLVADLKDRGINLEENELRLAAAQMVAAVMMMSLVPQFFQKSFGFDMHDEETRGWFVRRLVEKLLA